MSCLLSGRAEVRPVFVPGRDSYGVRPVPPRGCIFSRCGRKPRPCPGTDTRGIGWISVQEGRWKAQGREGACPYVWGRVGSTCPSTGGKKRRMAEQGIGLPGTRLRTAVPAVCFGRQPGLPAAETGAFFAAILRPCPATVPRRTHPVRVARQVSVWCHMASHQGGNLVFCRLTDLSEHFSGLASGRALVRTLPGRLRDSPAASPCGHGGRVS